MAVGEPDYIAPLPQALCTEANQYQGTPPQALQAAAKRSQARPDAEQQWKFCHRAPVAALGCDLRLLIPLECLGCVCQGAARD